MAYVNRSFLTLNSLYMFESSKCKKIASIPANTVFTVIAEHVEHFYEFKLSVNGEIVNAYINPDALLTDKSILEI